MLREVSKLECFSDNIFVGFKDCDLQIFKFYDEKLHWVSTSDHNEHDSPIVGFDYLASKEIFITCCKQGIVKIWDNNKNLIREISFSDPITSVCFLNEDGDILIAHTDKSTLIFNEKYGLNDTQIKYN